MQNNQINLDKITDIRELKVLKADAYDQLAAAQAGAQQAQANLQALNTRIAQLQEEQKQKDSK